MTATDLRPNWRRGASAIERMTVEQFGLVTSAPVQPRALRCASMRPRWSLLISGTSSGTSGAMRWLRALLTTKWPALAKASSISPATEASIAENSSSGGLPAPGRASWTTRSATSTGIDTGRRQGAALRYACPADRSLAPTQVRRNHGWLASCAMNCWPTIPVAPSTPTSIRCMTRFSFCRAEALPHILVGGAEGPPYVRSALEQKKTRRSAGAAAGGFCSLSELRLMRRARRHHRRGRHAFAWWSS